jgi:hypothetical protein
MKGHDFNLHNNHFIFTNFLTVVSRQLPSIDAISDRKVGILCLAVRREMIMFRTNEKDITLQLPGPEIADRGTVRLGSGCISATFPPLRLPSSEVATATPCGLGPVILPGAIQR